MSASLDDNHAGEAANRRNLLVARVTAVAFGAVNAWSSRHAVNPGGVAHLDMADAILRGDFSDAVNGYFSPLYSVVLAPALLLSRGHPAYEAAVVHGVNFLIYILALVMFDRFLAAMKERASRRGHPPPDATWTVFGYAAFIWSSLFYIGVAQMTGDLLVAAFMYGAGAILARTDGRIATMRAGAALGLLLGLAYLSKTAMLPLSLLFLGAALAPRVEWKRNKGPVAMATAVLLCVSLPFITALSIKKERPTIGDIGKLVYAWFVLDMPKYAHWQGDNPAGYGVPAHPDRRLQRAPDVFEYATPLIGTHPLFYDPSYWYEGLEVPIAPAKILRALVEGTRVYWRMAVEASAELLALGVLLLWTGIRAAGQMLAGSWRLFLPVIAAFPMFALVHTEPRFVGGFVTMALLLSLSCARLPDEGLARRFVVALLVGAGIVMGMRSLVATLSNAHQSFGVAQPAYELALGLKAAGVRNGDQLGVIGASFDSYWARLASARIIAEVPAYDVDRFWHGTTETRRQVYETFRKAGVRFLVAWAVPPGPAAAGWQPIGAKGAFIYDLRPEPGKQ